MKGSKMKFGISFSIFPIKFGPIVFSGENIKENLKIIKELGYDGIDLFLQQMKEKELKNLRTVLNYFKLEISLVAAISLAEQGVNLSDPSKRDRLEAVEKFKKQIKVAGKLGGNMALGFIRGNKEEDEPESIYQERLADSLKRLIDFADEKGVKLLLEPINRYEINTFLRVDQSLEFIYKYDLDKIELLIDTFHMNIEESSIEGTIKMAGPKLGHVHITDSNRRAPGDGHLDYNSILKVIKDTGYNGFLTIEAFPIPSSYECGKRGIEYLRKILSSLT